MMESSRDRILTSVNLLKPLISSIDEIGEKYKLNRNRTLELLLAIGVSTFREWERQFETALIKAE
jgi:hypothetical protein